MTFSIACAKIPKTLQLQILKKEFLGFPMQSLAFKNQNKPNKIDDIKRSNRKVKLTNKQNISLH